VQYYRRLGALHDVDANRSVDEVRREICQLVSGSAGRGEEMAINYAAPLNSKRCTAPPGGA